MIKKHLIFFHPYSNIGGADNSLARLISSLDYKKYKFTFISLNKSILPKIIKKKVKIKFIKLNSTRTLFSIFKLRNIINNILKKNYNAKNIIISNQNFANIIIYFALYKIEKIKIIFIERNHLDELKFFNNFKDFIKKKIIYYLIKFIYKKVDLVIGISKKLCFDLKLYTNAKIKLIYNPAFDKNIIKRSNFFYPSFFNKNSKFIINVGRFTKRKNQIFLIRAFEQVIKKFDNIKLILIGYGDELTKIKKYIALKQLENDIIIISKCLNPYPYIKNSDLFVLTSKYEGFANVIVESVVLNTPVISANCNSGPSEILLNGKGGDLYKPNSIIDLIKKINNFFNNPKILKSKTTLAKKSLYRFDKIHSSKIYNKVFDKI
ncbi:glycosyltransferase [Candidatus Fonsibacter ubiquis]|uniref:glycosyltransferase n=1 Tax=Candidatus Fonsibacter ubiquis TaxID=1925548 RepID=UPI000C0883A5|nr:glycosyltransferase [Candidatus Fonsibacter ubiquis]